MQEAYESLAQFFRKFCVFATRIETVAIIFDPFLILKLTIYIGSHYAYGGWHPKSCTCQDLGILGTF